MTFSRPVDIIKVEKKGGGKTMKEISNDHFDYQSQNLPFILYKNVPSIHKGFYTNWHTEPEFILVVAGSETISVDDATFLAQPGDIIAVDPGRMHTGFGADWKHHCLIPSVDFLNSLEIIPSSFSLTSFIRDKEMTELFLDIVRASDREELFKRSKIMTAAGRFLLNVYTKYAKQSSPAASLDKGSAHFAISVRVINYLLDHFATDFPIEDIANEIGVNVSYMCRCVKKSTGKTIVDHLNIIRCRAAYHYLTQTDRSIYEIAALCGFHSNSYFARIYQQIMGVSPSETRRKQGKKSGSGEE